MPRKAHVRSVGHFGLGVFFDYYDPYGPRRRIYSPEVMQEEDSDPESVTPQQEPEENPCIVSWLGPVIWPYTDMQDVWITRHMIPTSPNIIIRDIYWNSAARPVILVYDKGTRRVYNRRWKWWYALNPIALLAWLADAHYESYLYVCARVFHWHDSNCGFRIIATTECKSEVHIHTVEQHIDPLPTPPPPGIPVPDYWEDPEEVPIYVPPPPDVDEPEENWQYNEILVWDWRYGCKPYQFAYAKSFKWLDDVFAIIAADPDLKYVSHEPWMDGGVQKQQVTDGSCVEDGIMYGYRFIYLSKIE
jgi:hypothetical protein